MFYAMWSWELVFLISFSAAWTMSFDLAVRILAAPAHYAVLVDPGLSVFAAERGSISRPLRRRAGSARAEAGFDPTEHSIVHRLVPYGLMARSRLDLCRMGTLTCRYHLAVPADVALDRGDTGRR